MPRFIPVPSLRPRRCSKRRSPRTSTAARRVSRWGARQPRAPRRSSTRPRRTPRRSTTSSATASTIPARRPLPRPMLWPLTGAVSSGQSSRGTRFRRGSPRRWGGRTTGTGTTPGRSAASARRGALRGRVGRVRRGGGRCGGAWPGREPVRARARDGGDILGGIAAGVPHGFDVQAPARRPRRRSRRPRRPRGARRRYRVARRHGGRGRLWPGHGRRSGLDQGFRDARRRVQHHAHDVQEPCVLRAYVCCHRWRTCLAEEAEHQGFGDRRRRCRHLSCGARSGALRKSGDAGRGALLAEVRRRHGTHPRKRAPCGIRKGKDRGSCNARAHEAHPGVARSAARRRVPGAARGAGRHPLQRPARGAPATDADRRPGRAALRRAARGEIPGARRPGDRRARGKGRAGASLEPRTVEALFRPRAVALIGASGDPAKNTARPQRYLRKHGYTGRIVPINPGREEVLGEKAFATLSDVPGEIDHAFIMIEDVERAIEACGTKRVPVASIYSNGFADSGPDGAARQKKLVAAAQALGVRILGPNSMGVVDIPGRMALTVNAILEMERLPAGGTSIVSQSGTMLGTVLSRGAARGLGFAKLVSVGNEADLGVGELVQLLAADDDTRVVLLFLETIRDPGALASACRACHAAGKPVVAYKLGRSALGEALARSHTGALAGADAAIDAYFRDCGIVRVDLLETLSETPPLLRGRRPPDLARPGRVAVVTTTGGGAATVVDRLGLAGIEALGPRPDA